MFLTEMFFLFISPLLIGISLLLNPVAMIKFWIEVFDTIKDLYDMWRTDIEITNLIKKDIDNLD